MRLSAGILLLIVSMLFLNGCNRKQRGHFPNRASKQSRIKVNPGNQNINDCDVMEKNREKRARQSQKTKKTEVKIIPSDKGKPVARTKADTSKSKTVSQKGKSKRKKGIPFALKVGVIALLGLGAIAFVVVSAVIVLISFALSIVFIPLIISLASFLVSSIAFGFIKLHEHFRRRRWQREEREYMENQQEKEEQQQEPQQEDENLEEE